MADSAEITEGHVLLTFEDGVAQLRLNRPEAANGMSVELLRDLYEAVMVCHGHPDLRAVVVSGAGKNFCAGGDIKTFAAKGEALPDYIRQATAWLQDAVQALMRLEAPVIAAVQGYATGGGGFGLVCAVDLVVAGKSAKFLSGASMVGMSPDAGTSVTLPAIVGMRKAMEILLTNPTLDAEEAAGLGLVTKVVADEAILDEATALARELATGPKASNAAIKRLLRQGKHQPAEACFTEEARTVAALSGTADAREGLASMIERRPAKFGRG